MFFHDYMRVLRSDQKINEKIRTKSDKSNQIVVFFFELILNAQTF